MYRTLTFLISFFLAFSSQASLLNQKPDDDQQALYESIFKVAEQKGIDKGIFAAIILQESGDPRNDWQINPYALNVGGVSFYPESKQDAYKMVMKAVLRGEKQIGVGAGQIEWVYHGSKFDSFWAALDLDTNLDKASDYYLKMVKLCKGDSWCAAGKYHNQYPKIAKKYEKSVRQRWTMLKQLYPQL